MVELLCLCSQRPGDVNGRQKTLIGFEPPHSLSCLFHAVHSGAPEQILSGETLSNSLANSNTDIAALVPRSTAAVYLYHPRHSDCRFIAVYNRSRFHSDILVSYANSAANNRFCFLARILLCTPYSYK